MPPKRVKRTHAAGPAEDYSPVRARPAPARRVNPLPSLHHAITHSEGRFSIPSNLFTALQHRSNNLPRSTQEHLIRLIEHMTGGCVPTRPYRKRKR